MPDWMLQLIGPISSGAVTGLVLIAGLRVEVKNMKESMCNLNSTVRRAHTRIDEHIERHHIIKGGQ